MPVILFPNGELQLVSTPIWHAYRMQAYLSFLIMRVGTTCFLSRIDDSLLIIFVLGFRMPIFRF